MIAYLLVFLGGGIGSICRFFLTKATPPTWAFPYATLLANLLSCFILGSLIGLRMRGALPQNAQFLLASGFCGGFSTFSTFSMELLQMFEEGQLIRGMAYMGISLLSGLLFLFVGIRLLQ
jgi:CrcB protein